MPNTEASPSLFGIEHSVFDIYLLAVPKPNHILDRSGTGRLFA
jgi:hypothetical protein